MSVVTRSKAKSGSSGADSNEDESGEELTSGTADEAVGIGPSDRTLEILKLQLEIERVKLAQVQSRSERGSRDSTKMGELAKELRAVLAPMPESGALAPAWFKSAETMMNSCETPEEARGAIILPFLGEKTRAMVASRAGGRVLSFMELRELVLSELKMTPEEYKRIFYKTRKESAESWSQFATQLDIMFGYYLESREVETVDELRKLIISDRMKHLMAEDARMYVLQNETKDWLRPKELAQLAERFGESKRGTRGGLEKRESTGKQFVPKQDQRSNKGTAAGRGTWDRSSAVRCHTCGKQGHYRNECPQSRPVGDKGHAEAGRSGAPKLAARAAVGPVGRPTEAPVAVEADEETTGLTWLTLQTGNVSFQALLDSGADITVLRSSIVIDQVRGQGKGKVSLRGAFGHKVSADLMYVPLGLELAGKDMSPQVTILCAVTDELAEGVDALLTPDALEELERAQKLLSEEAKEIIAIEEARTKSEQSRKQITPLNFESEADAEEATEASAVNLVTGSVTPEAADPTFAEEQKIDSTLESLWEQARCGTHGMVIRNGLLFHEQEVEGKKEMQLVLPKSRHAEVLRLAHDTPCGGHFSQKKTKQRIRSAFFWPTMAADVKRHCQACHECQVCSRGKVTDRVPITPLTRPERPFETVYMDCIGPLEPSSARGHKYALTVVDLCTRWPEVIPLRSLTAKATCQALVDVFSRYGVPELICCDQGTNFTSQLTKELLDRLGVQIRFSAPDHPQSNGIVERWNGTFKAMLRHVVSEKGGQWDLYVPCLLWAYREVPNEITGSSPFELMYGREPQGPLTILRKTWTGEWTPPLGLNKPTAEYLRSLRDRMAEAARVVNEHSEALQSAYAQKYNLRARPKSFEVGEQVLVLETGMANKLQPKWLGPAVVTEQKRSDSYIVRFAEGNERWVHANKLRRYIVHANNVGVIFESDDDFGPVESVPSGHTHDVSVEEILAGSENLTQSQTMGLKQLLMGFPSVFSERPGRCEGLLVVSEPKNLKDAILKFRYFNENHSHVSAIAANESGGTEVFGEAPDKVRSQVISEDTYDCPLDVHTIKKNSVQFEIEQVT
ncbi:uncharacterized protein LOC115320635 [Ixodes scapularis]|uniref:uncharacterized protein LOC115320635 n=1 Tax=Ixodes scapularis TaxID=6945 RepID=UPI001A9F21E7|nr:uncharacterized protein LOC115320635 [Ixodes scapularis]